MANEKIRPSSAKKIRAPSAEKEGSEPRAPKAPDAMRREPHKTPCDVNAMRWPSNGHSRLLRIARRADQLCGGSALQIQSQKSTSGSGKPVRRPPRRGSAGLPD